VVKFYEPDIDEDTSLCCYGTPEVRHMLKGLSLALKERNNNKGDQ